MTLREFIYGKKEEKPQFSEESFANKLEDIRKETEKELKNVYPNKTIQVRLTSHKRDFKKQEENLKKGASKSSISLHNFGAAGDFAIIIDGKYQNAQTPSTLEPYKVLGSVALDNDLFWGWDFDPGHIAETRFVDEFLKEYPHIMDENKDLEDWYSMNADTTQAGYKSTMETLDKHYGMNNPDRVYLGNPRTIDPLLKPANIKEEEEEKAIEDSLIEQWK